MRKKQPLGLSTFDDQLLDGLEFCRKVYDLFDQVQNGPDGIAKLRLRPSKNEKRLVEEPSPSLATCKHATAKAAASRYAGSVVRSPMTLSSRSSGGLVEHHMAPKKLFIEVTTAVHQNDHLARRLLHQRGGSFGVKGISQDKKTGEIISKPHVHSNDELPTDLADQIIERLSSKSAKPYPPGTVLIVNCFANSLILDPEWDQAIERVKKAHVHRPFREVFLIETVMSHSTTLYGDRKRRQSPKRK
jgi:hypothetical protein